MQQLKEYAKQDETPIASPWVRPHHAVHEKEGVISAKEQIWR